MEWLNSTFILLGMLLVRFGLPLFATILIIWWMRRMDERWKQQSEHDLTLSLTTQAQARNSGCWDVHSCSAEQRARCPAYADPRRPCWQVFRQSDGRLQERCLLCQVFRQAPVPV